MSSMVARRHLRRRTDKSWRIVAVLLSTPKPCWNLLCCGIYHCQQRSTLLNAGPNSPIYDHTETFGGRIVGKQLAMSCWPVSANDWTSMIDGNSKQFDEFKLQMTVFNLF